MNGTSRKMWGRMKALGEKLEECGKEMDRILGQFHVEEDDEDYFEAGAGISDAIGAWWRLCDRYHDGDFVEEEYWGKRNGG